MEQPLFSFDFNDIAIFVEVAKVRSISGAAKTTGVSPSSVSRRLFMLEKRLGIQLLTRTTRKVLLTEAGKLYYDQCAHVLEQAQNAQDMLLSHCARTRGVLKVRLPDSLEGMQFAAFLSRFAAKWPELRFCYDYGTDRNWENARDFDIALRWGRQADSDLVARQLAQIEFQLYASSQYLALRGVPTEPAQLAEHDCLRVNACKELSGWTLHREGSHAAIEPRCQFELSDMDLARRLAHEGSGIVALPASARHDGKLQAVLPGWRLGPIALYALYASRTPPARARVFIDAFIEHLDMQCHRDPAADSDKNDPFRSCVEQLAPARVEPWTVNPAVRTANSPAYNYFRHGANHE